MLQEVKDRHQVIRLKDPEKDQRQNLELKH